MSSYPTETPTRRELQLRERLEEAKAKGRSHPDYLETLAELNKYLLENRPKTFVGST